MERFSRLTQLIGNEKIELLNNKKIMIIGLGAVGGFAAEALARCAAGSFTLVDFDIIAVSNINRHIGALNSTIGKSKVDVIGDRIKDINQLCEIKKIKTFAHKDSFNLIFKEKPDIVIDAIDALGPKIELLAYCVANKIEVISSMGAALKTDPSKIKIADISETDVCPLARNIRKFLKRRGITEGITAVFSTEPAAKTGLRPPVKNNGPDQEEGDEVSHIRGRERNILGSYPIVTAMFGLYAAHAAIKIAINI